MAAVSSVKRTSSPPSQATKKKRKLNTAAPAQKPELDMFQLVSRASFMQERKLHTKAMQCLFAYLSDDILLQVIREVERLGLGVAVPFYRMLLGNSVTRHMALRRLLMIAEPMHIQQNLPDAKRAQAVLTRLQKRPHAYCIYCYRATQGCGLSNTFWPDIPWPAGWFEYEFGGASARSVLFAPRSVCSWCCIARIPDLRYDADRYAHVSTFCLYAYDTATPSELAQVSLRFGTDGRTGVFYSPRYEAHCAALEQQRKLDTLALDRDALLTCGADRAAAAAHLDSEFPGLQTLPRSRMLDSMDKDRVRLLNGRDYTTAIRDYDEQIAKLTLAIAQHRRQASNTSTTSTTTQNNV